MEAKLYAAVTGKDGRDLERYSNVISNLQRMILIRECRNLPTNDYPRQYLFEEPISGSPEIPEVMVPGPGETVVDIAGKKLDKEQFTRMLKEYYQLRGWDEDTGVPLYETLKSLGLEDLARDKQ